MPVPCPECAQVNRTGARFCDQCGFKFPSDLAAGVNLGRAVGLRHGTFVFCDLVQSTRLAERLDLDDLRTVYKGFQQTVAAVSRRHGGHLIRFVGDGAFMSFGFPEAREDAAESAVRTGLALVHSLGELEVPGNVSLELRVGIASGTVVTGDIVDEAAVHEDSVYGRVPALAVRLLGIAPPGGVVIADDTRKLAGGFFGYRDLGTHALKDFDRVRAWLVLAESAVVSRFDARHDGGHDRAIVGRDALLGPLFTRVDDALRGDGLALVLRGEAGMGKSRIARALRDRAAEAGARVFELDCSPRASNTPLQPVSVLLRRLAGAGQPQDTESVLERLGSLSAATFGSARADEVMPYLRIVLGETSDAQLPTESPERMLDKTVGFVSELLLAPAASGSVFVLCEDMHWADATTARLIARLSAAIGRCPLALVVTSRTAVSDLASPEHLTGSIELDGLDDAAAMQLLEAVAGGPTLGPVMAERILQRCDGNPLFLEEMARNVIETVPSASHADERDAQQVEIPMSIEALVQARIDRWPALKPVVQAASVLGREFSLPLLEELMRDRSDVPEAVAQLVDLDILLRRTEKGPNSLRFKHALIHDAIYQTLIRSDRQRLHSRAAEVLVQHFDGFPEATPDMLAQHLAGAQRYPEAIRCLTAAAAAAAACGAYTESIAHGRTGLGLASRIEDAKDRRPLELPLLTSLGVALAATQGYAQPEVQQVYEQARALCADEGDPVALFPVVRGLGTYYFVRGDLRQADQISAQCIALAEQAGRPDFLIEALSFSGYPALYRGRLAEAQADAERCMALYRAHGGEAFAYPSAQDAATAALSLLTTVHWLLGDGQASEAAVQALLAHVERLGRPFDSAYAHVWVASLRNLQRRFGDAELHANVGIDIAQRFGYNTWLAAAAMQGSMAVAVRSGAPQATGVLQATHAAFMMAGAECSASFYLWGQARALTAAGDTAGADAALARAIDCADATGETYLSAELLLTRAATTGDTDDAERHLRAALELAVNQGAVAVALRAAAMLLSRPDGDEAEAVRARSAIAVLDGTADSPDDAVWMQSTLEALQRSLARATIA